jgi:hypothetical protein
MAADDGLLNAGLLVGPVADNPMQIKVIILGNSSLIGKTIQITLRQTGFVPKDSLTDLLIDAYDPLLPSPASGWTAVLLDSVTSAKDGTYYADVHVLQNPNWDAELFSIRPPETQTINLVHLLGIKVVTSNPQTLSEFKNPANVSLELLEDVMHRFNASFSKLNYEIFWNAFERWNSKVEKKKTRHSRLLSVLALSVAETPSIAVVRERLGAVTGDDRIRIADVMFAPLLKDKKVFKHLIEQKDLFNDVSDWLFRRTFNETTVLISDSLRREFRYPENSAVPVRIINSGNDMLILLRFKHSESEFKHLRELWRIYHLIPGPTTLSGRRALLHWVHMEKHAEGGINFPFLQTALDMFNSRRSGTIQLSWEPTTKSFTKPRGLVSETLQ